VREARHLAEDRLLLQPELLVGREWELAGLELVANAELLERDHHVEDPRALEAGIAIQRQFHKVASRRRGAMIR